MNNYPTYKLGEVADYINGRAFKPSEWKENGLPIVRIQNLNDESAVYHYSDAEHEEKYLLHDGDLLFAWAASLGTYIWNGGEAWLNQHIFKVLPKQNVSKMYLYYALTSIIKELYSKSHGSGMVHVTKGKFEETEIPLPPLATQHAIVTRIETLFAELDKGMEHLRTAQQQIKTYRQAVLRDAFEGYKEMKTVLELSTIVTSGSRGWAKYYTDKKGARFVRITDLTRDKIALQNKNIQYISLPSNTEGKRSLLQPNDVLVSITADLGSIALVPQNIGEAYINQHIAMIRFKNTRLGKFMAYYLKSDFGQKELLKNKRGNGKLGLGLDDIKNTYIPFVAEEDAIEIVNKIESRLSQATASETCIENALQQAEALRQSILKKAFSGELI